MAKQAYNPVEYKQDFMNLATTAPAEAADVAMKWRDRFMNQATEMRKSTEQALEIGIAGASAFGFGFFDGGWEAKREAMIVDWEEEGHIDAGADLSQYPEPFSHPEGGKDPTKLFGMVDKVLVGTLILAGLAIFNVFGPKYTPFVRSAALGGAAYWAGSVGRSLGMKRTVKKIKEKAAEESGQAATGT
jgi:hypothetical protein